MYMAEEYVNASKIQLRDAIDIVEEFSKEMSEMKGRCIDIGCGPGDVTKRLILPRLAPDAELVGADISKAMIEHARRKFRGEERLSFVELDIETVLPEEEIGRYCNALSFYCLHWCQNTSGAFENIYKLLKPGGKALLMFLASNNGFNAYMKVHENPRYRPYMQDADRFVPFFHRCKNSRATLRKMLEDIGFEVLHCSRREKSFVYENMEMLRNHILAVNPFLRQVPNHMKEEFSGAVVREITNRMITLPKEGINGEQEYSLMDRYEILVACLIKPSVTC